MLAAVRRVLRPGGVALIADEKTADRFTAPADETERAYYGFSVFTCLPAAMTERPTAAIGTVIRESTMRRLATTPGSLASIASTSRPSTCSASTV